MLLILIVSIYLFEIYKLVGFWFEFLFNWNKSNEIEFRLDDFNQSVYFFFIIMFLIVLLLLTNLFFGINKASLGFGLFYAVFFHRFTINNLSEIEGDIRREADIRRKQFSRKRIINFWILVVLTVIQFSLI